MTVVRAAQQDEQRFLAVLDRWSPDLLGLALAFADDAGTAHRLVELGWTRALHGGLLDDPTSVVRTAVVRAMAGAVDGRAAAAEVQVDDQALLTAQRTLRHALRAAGVLVLPRQRTGRPEAPAGSAPRALDLGYLRRLPAPLRLVLLLTDVQHWPAAEVEVLLEVRPAAHRSILGHARRALLTGPVPRSASA